MNVLNWLFGGSTQPTTSPPSSVPAPTPAPLPVSIPKPPSPPPSPPPLIERVTVSVCSTSSNNSEVKTPNEAPKKSSLSSFLEPCGQKEQGLKGDFSFLTHHENLKEINNNPEPVIEALYTCAAHGVKGAAGKLYMKLTQLNEMATPKYGYFGRHTLGLLKGALQKAPLIEEIQTRATRDGYITFYNARFTPLTQVFGNFYEGSITYEGVTYKTAEGAFHAQKFLWDPNLPLDVRNTIIEEFKNADGDTAFRLGGKDSPFAQWFNPTLWEDVKVQEMYEICLVKYKTDPFAKAALLATGNALLIEHNEVKMRDTFWSDDCDGTGNNMLGLILMDIRNELRNINIPSNYRFNWLGTCPHFDYGLQNGYKNNGA